MAAVRLAVLIALLLLATGCTTRGEWLVGAKGVEILKHPSKVEAYHSSVNVPRPGARDAVDAEIQLMEPAQELDPGFGPRLAKLLLSNRSYYAPGLRHRTGRFYPIVAYRVWKGLDWVDVRLDFDLDVLQVRTFNSATDETIKHTAFFDPAHQKLLRLTKEAFITYGPIMVLN